MNIFTTHNHPLAGSFRHNAFPDHDMLNSQREIVAEHLRMNDAAAMAEYAAFAAPPPLKTSAAGNFPIYQFVHGQVSPLPSPSEQHAFDSESDTASWSRSEQHQPPPSFSTSEPAPQIQDTSSAYSSHVHSPSTDPASAVSPMLVQPLAQTQHQHSNQLTYSYMPEQSQHEHASPHPFQELAQSPLEQTQQQLYNHHPHEVPQHSALPFHPDPRFATPWPPVQHPQGLLVDPAHASAFFAPQNEPMSSSSSPSSSSSYHQHEMRQAPYHQAARHSEPHIPVHGWDSGPALGHVPRAYVSESYTIPHDHSVARESLAPQIFPSLAPHHAAQVQQQMMHGGAVYASAVHEQEAQHGGVAHVHQVHPMHHGLVQPAVYQPLGYGAEYQEGTEQSIPAPVNDGRQSVLKAESPQPRPAEAALGSQPSASGTKRKRPHNMTSEQKRDLSLQRNREAAAKCRGKKKQRDNETNVECKSLCTANQGLKDKRKQMQDELSALRDQILSVAASGCEHEMQDITQWISENSKTGGSRFRWLMTDWTLTDELKAKREALKETDEEAAKTLKRMEAEERRMSMGGAGNERASCEFHLDGTEA